MKKWIIRILLILFFIIIAIAGIFIYSGYNMYKEALDTISLEDKINKVRQDKNFVKLDSLPQDYKNAVISVEDRRFKDHGAIDFVAIGRAIYVNVTNFKLLEGGSTITQQVAKNLYFISEEDPITRKIAEIFMAFDLENNYSKDDILELYVNTIYFGDGYYGIKEACNGYLNKEPSNMNLSDSTMMAGIPNAPSVYAPTANPELTKKRQEKVISTMVENGYLSSEQASSVKFELAF